jgi:hypothetical protein
MATPCTGFVIGFSTSHWEVEVVGTRGREEVRERAAVLILERERDDGLHQKDHDAKQS